MNHWRFIIQVSLLAELPAAQNILYEGARNIFYEGATEGGEL